MKLFLSFLFFLLLQGIIFGQTTYVWNLVGDGSWTTASNWSPSRNTPAANDILVINNGGTKSITGVPTQSIGKLLITGNTNVTLIGINSGNSIITISTAAIDALDIDAGSTLQIRGIRQGSNEYSLTVTISNTIGLQANIDGILKVTRETVSRPGTLGIFTKAGANATINFNGGSVYSHDVDGSLIPTSTWNSTSTCNITGLTNTAPTGLGQSFGHFTYDCPDHATLINFNSALTSIAGNFTVRYAGEEQGARTLNGLALSANTNFTLNIGGNLIIDHYTTEATWLIMTTGTANVTMNIAGDFLMSNTGGSGSCFFDFKQGGATAMGTLVVNVAGNLTMTGGYLDLAFQASAYTVATELRLTGNLSVSATSIIISSGANIINGKIIFNKSGIQTIFEGAAGAIAYTNFQVNSGSTLSLLSNIFLFDFSVIKGGKFEVLSGGILNAGTFQIPSSTGATVALYNGFTLNSGAKIITANANGVHQIGFTGPTISAAIATRVFSSGADYEFQGARTGTFVTTPTASTARDIIINNASADVQLDQSMSIDRALDFLNRRFNIGINILTINSTGTISGSSSSRYVITVPTTGTNGRLRQNSLAVAAKLFPIGTATNYLPVTITPASTGSDFSVNVFRSTTTNGLPTGGGFNPRTMQADAVYWIDRPVGTSNAQIRFDWQTDAIEGSVFTTLPTSPNKIGIWRLVSGTWVLANGTSSTNYIANNTSNFVYTNGNLSTFGPAGTGYPYIVANIDILPLRITNLKATKTNNSALLNWYLASIDQVSHFEVQESREGRNFITIATVNATDKISYSFTDVDLYEGTNYYRIKVFEAQGEISYSYIVAVGNRLKAAIEFYNNPVQGQLYFKHAVAVNATYKIIDVSGRLVKAGRIPANAVVSQIDLTALAPGQYVLQFINEGETVSNQFIKQ